MTTSEEFLAEFEKWVAQQVTINEMALNQSQAVWKEEGDERAKEAALRYEGKLDAYTFLMGKFLNYREGKGFHDLPDGFFGERHY